MLPTNLRLRLFDKMSAVTMRPFFHPVPSADATGLVARVYEQVREDFFINGTITCHSRAPELMAGMWAGGRETALVDGHLPAWQKKAMGGALSQANQCPYCEDFLVSLTYGARHGEVARALRRQELSDVADPLIRRRLDWARAAVWADAAELRDPPFTTAELPEAIGTLLVFGYTNKISDLTMDGSPVPSTMKGASLRFFGGELKGSSMTALRPGAGLELLEPAPPADDLDWARSHPRIHSALSSWIAAVDTRVAAVLPQEVRQRVEASVRAWRGGKTPLSRSWVEDEVAPLSGAEQDLARVALLAAKASFQIDDDALQAASDHGIGEPGLIALGAYGALLGARRVAEWTAEAARDAVASSALVSSRDSGYDQRASG